MFCTQCGTKNNETGNFCIQCGSPLTTKRTETAPQQAQPFSVGSPLRVEIKKEPLFFECLNSFERLENLSTVTTKCKKAIEAGLHPIDKAIVHGLLMHRYAKQKDLQKAQEEQLRSREVMGRIIGLSNQELQIFKYKHVEQEYRPILDRLIDHPDDIARGMMIREILICPVCPSGFRADLTDKDKERGCVGMVD